MKYYGFNPSGGVHRFDDVTSVFEMFTLSPSSWGVSPIQTHAWVPVELEYYQPWIDWRPLSDMPVEVQKAEGVQ